MESKNEEYNGYTNYETWLLCLNIDNEYNLYNAVRDIVAYGEEKDNYELGELIKEYLEEMFYSEEFQVYKICDTWTLRDWQEINWTEVAETRRGD